MLRKSLLLPLLFLLLTPAQAQNLDRAARQGIDAHAFSFSGRHCSGGIEAKPGSEATPGQFKIGALIMDEAMKETAAKDKTVRYRSSFNDKDLYRAQGLGVRHDVPQRRQDVRVQVRPEVSHMRR